MASIKQTYPHFFGGISEQVVKQPGQVNDIVNAIPDLTWGLYKRPGSERIGTNPLANVQSGGSWFHYYRDETEGSYIGQVAADGKVRMWCTKDLYNASGTKVNSAGDEIFVHYDAVSGAYTQSNYSSSTAAHTAITSYLASTDTENIQTCTVSDTTFINNKSKVVEVDTLKTINRPNDHCAYIELLRSENGRQYGLNISSPTADFTTNENNHSTLKRATRVKIDSDTLSEVGGTGTCPGIGTQVFSVTAASSYSDTSIVSVKNANGDTLTSGRDNLIFRITTVGQQGQISSYDNDIPYTAFACTYNRQVVLLHGGEGWEVGDIARVKLTQAKTEFEYEIVIDEIEEIKVKAKISSIGDGLIRPTPTPFNIDTAVTIDTILGGIISELPSSISSSVIGNGIYLHSSSAFNIEVVETDLMRVMQTTTNTVSELPIQCKHNYIVKVSNSESTDDDDYYLRFDGEEDRDGIGVWTECAEPNIDSDLKATTMPHVLQRQSISGTNPVIFLLKKFTWGSREVGDTNTNKNPFFVGSSINKIISFRDRLAFLSGANITLSRSNTFSKPNFWVESALGLSPDDRINISCSSNFPSDLHDGLEINSGLLVFSSNEQFLLSSGGDTTLNNDTAKLKSVSNYNYNKNVPPINLGVTAGFLDNSGKYSKFYELANVAREGEPMIGEQTKLVPSLLNKNIDLLTNSRENSIILFGKTNENIIYGFKYFNIGEERSQSSWFKWKFNNKLLYHFISEDSYYYLDEDKFLQKINLIQTEGDLSIDFEGNNYMLHVDNWVPITGGTYYESTNTTTFSTSWLTSVTTPDNDLVLIDSTGRYSKATTSGTTITVNNDWTSGTRYAGYNYEYSVKFPKIYVYKTDGRATRSDLSASLTIHRVTLNFGKVGVYETTLDRAGKLPYTELYESSDLGGYDLADAPYLAEKFKTIPVYERNTNVDITLKSTHPSPATLHSMDWEGDYTQRYYKRV